MKKLLLLFLLLFIPNVKAMPANDSFIDDNLYKCVIDAYNVGKTDKKDYAYNILPEELITIKSMDCSIYKGLITDLTGLNKMTGLTSLNLSGNEFLGGSLNIKNQSTGSLKSLLKLPKSLTLTNKKYEIEDENILKIENNVVVPLQNGSTSIIMTAKVSGYEIKEKYLVSINNDSLAKSNNSKLASLYLSKGEFKFNSDTKDYTIIVGESTSSVKINANVLDKTASFVDGFGPRTVNLNIGTNKVLVKVKAEDNSTSTYTLNIIRSEGSDENVKLTNIELSVGKIDFNPDVFIYNFTVDSNVNEIEVKGVPISTLSTVEVSDTKLKVGENNIVITVTSESGSKKAYQLLVTREDYDSLDNYLSNLTINKYNISFNRNVFNYNLNIGFESTLDIKPILEKNTSTFTIEGNKELKDGSKVLIKVKDTEGSTRTYTINISKNILSSINYKTIILLIEFIIIIILLIVLITKPKRKEKNNSFIN